MKRSKLIGTSLAEYRQWMADKISPDEIIKRLDKRGLDRDLCEFLMKDLGAFVERKEATLN